MMRTSGGIVYSCQLYRRKIRDEISRRRKIRAYLSILFQLVDFISEVHQQQQLSSIGSDEKQRSDNNSSRLSGSTE